MTGLLSFSVLRPVLVLLAVPALVGFFGCGDEERTPAAHVKLSIDGPGDGTVVRGDVVSVRGTVRPRAAAVEVAGERASVVNGSFSVDVPVRSGANVLDVAATAPEARPALVGLRVTRDDRVTVPDLAGAATDDAKARLQDLDLEVRLRDGGGFLDPLLPDEPRVCETDPRPGTRVQPGTTVTVVTARLC